ncbi:hypothetical protein [Halalkalibacter urbisdiaboli]|uniref:hypothetical protein n=1 Tax=Halalkalibacter urbisdiaboli TaxID=1960589 RepID=UPI000B432927|nr:hypothetical protein [Halalkalibacter urbisdiaboli]
MENILYYITFLACPLMIGIMFFFMRGMLTENKTNKANDSTQKMQNNMQQLMEQNKKLMNEMEELKKSK